MGFNSAPGSGNIEKPKNNLNRLIGELKTDTFAWSQLIEIRANYENEWFGASKEKLGDKLTSFQQIERDLYVDSIELSRIREDIEARIKHCDTDIGNTKLPESERNEMKAYKIALEKIRRKLAEN